MRLSAEKRHLLQKGLKAALRPLEIFAGGAAGIATFGFVYYSSCFAIRYTDPTLSTLGVLLPLIAAIYAAFVGYMRYRSKRPSRSWIAAGLTMGCCFLPAYSMGDRYWWKYMVNYHTWKDMASYVNIDPDLDRGQSFMDSGTVYFKEGSFILRNHTVAFRNGINYCVAPIVRKPVEYEQGVGELPTINGFVVPRSGTVDFWAVGTDCCGNNGESFTCGDANSFMARSGLRVLDASSRSMYLLGVQEWSATTGLPVRHPLFFHWVKDPIMFSENLLDTCGYDFTIRLTTCVFLSMIISYLAHGALAKFYIS